ncbi:MAG: glycosyltransferase, partial [Planctomycetes bacterium]|nr:glycosyltransferase [Planctomycetota bacterium]
MPHPGVKIVLSVIAPAHNERENISELVTQLTTALSALGLEYEIIIVDDASDDGTLDILKDLQGDEPRLRVLHLPPRSTPR